MSKIPVTVVANSAPALRNLYYCITVGLTVCMHKLLHEIFLLSMRQKQFASAMYLYMNYACFELVRFYVSLSLILMWEGAVNASCNPESLNSKLDIVALSLLIYSLVCQVHNFIISLLEKSV